MLYDVYIITGECWVTLCNWYIHPSDLPLYPQNQRQECNIYRQVPTATARENSYLTVYPLDAKVNTSKLFDRGGGGGLSACRFAPPQLDARVTIAAESPLGLPNVIMLTNKFYVPHSGAYYKYN